MLEIKNLSVSVHGKPILDGLNLNVARRRGRGHHGPERLRQVDALLRHRRQARTTRSLQARSCSMERTCSTASPTSARQKGVFLAFQYPIEIPGVATMTFLKAALNAQRRAHGEADLTTPDFMRRVREASQALKIDMEMLRRPLNVGFSGGEKKRLEMLQMALHSAAPRRARRDGFGARHRRVENRGRRRQRACATQAGAFSSSLTISGFSTTSGPTSVHVMAKGRIVASGGPELAVELERNGYRDYSEEAA